MTDKSSLAPMIKLQYNVLHKLQSINLEYAGRAGTMIDKQYNTHPSTTIDKVGVLVSTGWIIHCLLLPIVVALLPALSNPFFENEWVHVTLAAVAVVVAYFALKRGFNTHGSKKPLYIAVPGLAFLWGSLLAHDPEWLETAIATTGALMVAYAHIVNHRLCRAS